MRGRRGERERGGTVMLVVEEEGKMEGEENVSGESET